MEKGNIAKRKSEDFSLYPFKFFIPFLRAAQRKLVKKNIKRRSVCYYELGYKMTNVQRENVFFRKASASSLEKWSRSVCPFINLLSFFES